MHKTCLYILGYITYILVRGVDAPKADLLKKALATIVKTIIISIIIVTIILIYLNSETSPIIWSCYANHVCSVILSSYPLRTSGVARVIVSWGGGKMRAPKARATLGGTGHGPSKNFEIYSTANAISCIFRVRFCRKRSYF